MLVARVNGHYRLLIGRPSKYLIAGTKRHLTLFGGQVSEKLENYSQFQPSSLTVMIFLNLIFDDY
jgi:hypothetical protein